MNTLDPNLSCPTRTPLQMAAEETIAQTVFVDLFLAAMGSIKQQTSIIKQQARVIKEQATAFEDQAEELKNQQRIITALKNQLRFFKPTF